MHVDISGFTLTPIASRIHEHERLCATVTSVTQTSDDYSGLYTNVNFHLSGAVHDLTIIIIVCGYRTNFSTYSNI